MLQKQIDRFWQKVKKTPTGCWLWQGARNRGNQKWSYGVALFGTRTITAHRIAYLLTVCATIPKGYFVCHHCDNPLCVNPEHLFIGTQKDNMKDCVQKNRISRLGRAWQTACVNGHSFTKENTYMRSNGWRDCLKCRKLSQAKRRAKRLTHTQEPT